MSLVNISLAKDIHLNFIRATWLKSYFSEHSRFCENLTWEVYVAFHPHIIENLLVRSKLLVAEPANERDVCVGYFAYEPPRSAHFVYVKHAFRKLGVASELFRASGLDPSSIQYSHRTGNCNWLHGSYIRVDDVGGRRKQIFKAGKFPAMVYNPYSVFN